MGEAVLGMPHVKAFNLERNASAMTRRSAVGRTLAQSYGEGGAARHCWPDFAAGLEMGFANLYGSWSRQHRTMATSAAFAPFLARLLLAL